MVVGEDVGAVELMREGGLTEEKKDSDSEEGEFLQRNELWHKDGFIVHVHVHV